METTETEEKIIESFDGRVEVVRDGIAHVTFGREEDGNLSFAEIEVSKLPILPRGDYIGGEHIVMEHYRKPGRELQSRFRYILPTKLTPEEGKKMRAELDDIMPRDVLVDTE